MPEKQYKLPHTFIKNSEEEDKSSMKSPQKQFQKDLNDQKDISKDFTPGLSNELTHQFSSETMKGFSKELGFSNLEDDSKTKLIGHHHRSPTADDKEY